MFADNFFGGGGDLFTQTFNNFFHTGVDPFFRFQTEVGRRIANPIPTTILETAARDRQTMRSARARPARLRNSHENNSEYDILPVGHGFSRGRGNADNAPVRYHRNRSQWFDPNSHQAHAPEPIVIPPTYMTLEEINNIPTYVYKAKKKRIKTIEQSQSNYCKEEKSIQGASASACNSKVGEHAAADPDSEDDHPAECDICLSECDICLSEFKPGNSIKPLACGHEFHSICLDEWLRKMANCPKCRLGVKAGFRKLERERKRAQITAAREKIRKRREEIANSSSSEATQSRSYATPSRIILKRGSSQPSANTKNKLENNPQASTSQKINNHQTSNLATNNQSSIKKSSKSVDNNPIHRKKHSVDSLQVNRQADKTPACNSKAGPKSDPAKPSSASSKPSPESAKPTSPAERFALKPGDKKLLHSEGTRVSQPTASSGDPVPPHDDPKQKKDPVTLSINARKRAVEAALKRQEEFFNTLNNGLEE